MTLVPVGAIKRIAATCAAAVAALVGGCDVLVAIHAVGSGMLSQRPYAVNYPGKRLVLL